MINTTHWYITESYTWKFLPPQSIEFLMYVNDDEVTKYSPEYDESNRDTEVRVVVELPFVELTAVKVYFNGTLKYETVIDLADASLGDDNCLKEVLKGLNAEFVPLILDDESKERYDKLVQEQFDRIQNAFSALLEPKQVVKKIIRPSEQPIYKLVGVGDKYIRYCPHSSENYAKEFCIGYRKFYGENPECIGYYKSV